MPDYQPTIGGLELPATGENRIPRIALGVLKTLHERGELEGKHAINAELIMMLSERVGSELARGKMSIAVVTATKQLAELIEALPGDEDSDAAAALMAELRQAQHGS